MIREKKTVLGVREVSEESKTERVPIYFEYNHGSYLIFPFPVRAFYQCESEKNVIFMIMCILDLKRPVECNIVTLNKTTNHSSLRACSSVDRDRASVS